MRPVLPRTQTAWDCDPAEKQRAQTANLYSTLQAANRQLDRRRPPELRQQIGGHIVLEDLLEFASACLATEAEGPKGTANLLASQADAVFTRDAFSRILHDVLALDRVYRSAPLTALAARIPFLPDKEDRRSATHDILAACWKLAPQPCSLVLAALVPALFHGPADPDNGNLFTRLGAILPETYRLRVADALSAMRLHTVANVQSAVMRALPDERRAALFEERLRLIAVLPHMHRFEPLACVAADRIHLPVASLPDMLGLLFGAAQTLPHAHYMLLLRELCGIDRLPRPHMLLNLSVLLHVVLQLPESDAVAVLDRLIDHLTALPEPERMLAVEMVRVTARRCLAAAPLADAAD